MGQNRTICRNWGRRLSQAVAVGALCALPSVMLADPPSNTDQNNQAQMSNQDNQANPDQNQTASDQPLSLPAGFAQKNLNADSDLKMELVKITDRAVSHDSYEKLLNELSKPDKDRVQIFKNADRDRLNKSIDEIKTAWKSKYGQDLDVTDTNLTFGDKTQIVQGVVLDQPTAVNNWPVPATSDESTSPANAGVQNPGFTGNSANQNVNGSARNPAIGDKAMTSADRLQGGTPTPAQFWNLELTNDTEVALVRCPGKDGHPGMTISMVHEALGGWTISLPSSRTGDQFYNDYATELSDISSHVNQWPADQAEGYRMLSHHIMAAIYGVQPHESVSANAQ